MQRKPPEPAPVAVVLLNYDGKELLERCVRSLCAQTVFPRRIYFVDNGSQGFDERKIREKFAGLPHEVLSILRLEANVGYARGMNMGLRRALDENAAAWLMTLSNDTELAKDFFANVKHSLENADEKTGMLCSKNRAMDRPEFLDGTGISLSLDGMSTARGQREIDRGQYDLSTDIMIPNGVSAIYRAEMLREIGLLDERFWAYCEDTDLGLRGWLAGWGCVFSPACVVFHARSSTLGEHSLKKLYLVERNHYWVAIKNLPFPVLMLNPAFTAYRLIVQVAALALGKGQGEGYGKNYSKFELVKTTLKAIADAALDSRELFEERRRLLGFRRRGSLEVLRKLWKARLPFHKLILK